MKVRTSVRTRRPVESAAMVEAAVADVTVAEITVMEPVVTEVPAMRGIIVMVEGWSTAVPVVPPVAPAPAKSSEEADTKPDTEGESDAAQKNSRHRIPARVGNDRRPVHEPRIIGRHVHHLRVGRFDDDCVALRRHLLLFIAIQMASLTCLLTQGLYGIRHILRLAYICLAKRRRPGQVLVHVFKNRGELRHGLYARIPVLFVDFFGQFVTLQIGMPLHPAFRLDNLRWIRGSG